jgi:hypothetical protein
MTLSPKIPDDQCAVKRCRKPAGQIFSPAVTEQYFGVAEEVGICDQHYERASDEHG